MWRKVKRTYATNRLYAELENDGHDSTLAREILATLEKTQSLHVEARDRLIKELSEGH